jgi:hypothetical protein
MSDREPFRPVPECRLRSPAPPEASATPEPTIEKARCDIALLELLKTDAIFSFLLDGAIVPSASLTVKLAQTSRVQQMLQPS